MKLMKATLMRLWRLTRATSIVVGLAVMVGLVAGVASLAVAGPGSGGSTAVAVLKGVENIASTPTILKNTGLGPDNEALRLEAANSPALRLESKLAGQPALRLHVQPGSPPLAVDPGAGKVDNLVAAKADEATKALKADEATKALKADEATKALKADEATKALKADEAIKALKADEATKALKADEATQALKADEATHATNAANADTLDGKDSTDFMTSHLYIQKTVSGQAGVFGSTGLPNDFGFAQANCDNAGAGEDIALSGGWKEERGSGPLPVDFTIIRDSPIDVINTQTGEHVPFGWNVAWINGSTPREIEVWALCLDRGAPHQQ